MITMIMLLILGASSRRTPTSVLVVGELQGRRLLLIALVIPLPPHLPKARDAFGFLPPSSTVANVVHGRADSLARI
jgi:hypothetical protein